MYCRRCGQLNDDNAYRCTGCGEVIDRGPAMAMPGSTIPNYLAHSILVTLFCCLPLGIPAIVFAAQVNSKAAAGDIAGALDASRKAKAFCWWSFGLGLAGVVLYFLIGVLSGLAA